MNHDQYPVGFQIYVFNWLFSLDLLIHRSLRGAQTPQVVHPIVNSFIHVPWMLLSPLNKSHISHMFSKAAITEQYKPDSLNNRNLFFHICGRWKVKIQEAGLDSWEFSPWFVNGSPVRVSGYPSLLYTLVWLCKFWFLLLRTQVRLDEDPPEWFHLNLFNSFKALPPNLQS